MTTLLGYDRYGHEITAQTDLLRAAIAGADLSATVPSCPEWTLGQLARHVGGAHRWVEAIVRTRAEQDIPEDEVPDAEGPAGDDPAALDAWLADGAAKLVGALREAGTGAGVWTWAWERTTDFWARRMAHETVIHRADAALAAGVPFEVAPDVAADTIDELLQMVGFAAASGDPEAAELRGPGRTLHFHATDADGGVDAEWLVEFGEEGFGWRRGHEKATVAVRGPLTDVLLVLYRRLPADSDRVEVLGDAKLLDFWLERTSFG
ncbi:maleylpyruvate isomerase family mycothiol-dependent enzyme [Streptomyces sp. NPDC055036]